MPDLVLTEKFSWMAGVPELESVPKDRNVVRIRGIAGKSDVISKNNRHYAEEELKRSARTWIKAPVTINHADFTDPKNKIGQVVWMELDDDGLLEYEADIWKKPYVDLLRSKSTEIRGVSIQAEFLHNRCPKCGDRFYDEPTFRNHMKEEHFITVDAKQEPHGIHGQALSIVLAPEEPGIEGTTVEIMETASRGWTQLLETVTKTGIEKVNHMKKTTQVAIETPTTIAIGKTSKLPIKEQEKTASDYADEESCTSAGFHWYEDACHAEPKAEATEQEEKTPSDYADEESCTAAGFHWYDDGCHAEAKAEATEQEEHECGEGEHWDEEQGKCVPNKVEEQEEEPTAHQCQEGEHWDEEQGKCVADVAPPTEEAFKLKVANLKLPKPRPIHTIEIKLPKRLKIDEGCRWSAQGFSSGEACVAAMQGKVDDPEAFCYSKVEETSVKESTENIYEAQKHIQEKLKLLEGGSIYRDAQIAKTINEQTDMFRQTFSNFKTTLEKIHEQADANAKAHIDNLNETLTQIGNQINEFATTFQKKIANLPKDDVSWRKELPKITELTKQIKDASATIEKVNASLATSQTSLSKLEEKVENLKKDHGIALGGIEETVEAQKKDYEKILAAADKVVGDTVKQLEEKTEKLTDEKNDLTKKLTEKEEKTLKETEDLTKKLEEIMTRQENLEAKLKPEFKGKSPEATKGSDDPGTKDLEKLRRGK